MKSSINYQEYLNEIIANIHDGSLISCGEKLRYDSKLMVKCSNKLHSEFIINLENVLTLRWCNSCSLNMDEEQKLLRFQKIKDLFEKRYQGKFISSNITTLQDKCELSCLVEGHAIFQLNLRQIVSGQWCKLCKKLSEKSNRDKRLKELQEFAEKKNGKCLTDQFLSESDAMKWKCWKHDKIWEASASAICHGSWCSLCAYDELSENMLRDNPALSIDDLVKVATERYGFILDTEYKGIAIKYTWKCILGHEWQAIAGSVTRGSWCPECSGSFSERICRVALEQIFNEKFIRVRPKWLMNDTGRLLELDGYCDKLKIAFEHQGMQHYVEVSNFPNTLEGNIKNDTVKKLKCDQLNIKLIIIPALGDKTKIVDLKQVIAAECKRIGIALPDGFEFLKLDLNKAYLPESIVELGKLREIALAKGGELCSPTYLGNNEKLEWKCNKEHLFKMRPHNVKAGQWCAECYREQRRKGLNWCNDIAKQMGGECKATIYKSERVLIPWKCADVNHPIWNATPVCAKRSWCPECLNQKRLTKLSEIAKTRGQLLSKKYDGYESKLEWFCDKHSITFFLTPHNFMGGQWCNLCNKESSVNYAT